MLTIGITVAIAVTIIIVEDIYLAITKGFAGTLSWWMYTKSVQYPIIPAALCLIIGILIGHFFWSQSLNVTVPCAVTQ